MSAQNAKDTADEIVANLRIAPADKGRKYQMVNFLNDEECRFFYPRRAIEWQRNVNQYVSRRLREKGVRVERINLTPGDFQASGRKDTPEERRKFADEFLRMLPVQGQA